MSASDDDALHEDLYDFMDRFLTEVAVPEAEEISLRAQADGAPGEAAGNLLGAHVIGEWTLTPEELGQLWLIGRKLGGYSPEQLIGDYQLSIAAPGRAWRPADPPELAAPAPLLRGGGHGSGRGLAGKREFPATWTDDVAIAHTMDVARRPAGAVELPGNVFRAFGERDGVQLSVVVTLTGDVLTSYPVSGDGVVQVPRNADQDHWTDKLGGLLDVAFPATGEEPRRSLDELVAVGEWPYAATALRTAVDRLTPQQQVTLQHLAIVCGLPEA